MKHLSVALSLGAHAAALAWLVHATAVPAGLDQAPGPILVEIVSASPPEVLQEATVPQAEPEPPPEPEPPKPVASPRPVATPAPKPPAKVHHPPKTESRPAVPESSSAAIMATESAGASPSTSISQDVPSEPVPAASTPTATGGAPGAAEDSLRLYGETVWARIMSHKPTGIRLRGTVGLTFSIAHDGQLISSEVTASSGSDILDQVALTALREAAPFPPPPDRASARQLTFSIPFHFR